MYPQYICIESHLRIKSIHPQRIIWVVRFKQPAYRNAVGNVRILLLGTKHLTNQLPGATENPEHRDTPGCGTNITRMVLM